MQTAQTYLEVVSQRGERQLELRRVYRNLKNRELFLLAYGKLYANGGAMTPGVDPKDTVDAMSLKKIDEIIDLLDKGRYQWKPTCRIYIPKENGKQRPISIAGWKDKLLQEVIRMILSAYYEPQFSTASHGFRPGRGCHTALQEVLTTWIGAKWFIEGDIRACFDELEKDRLLKIIGRRIKDDRLMKLLRGMLNAGYLDDWTYHPTYSGVPQGGVLSPLLTNIYLNELDQYVAQTLIPEYTKGEIRQVNPEYGRLKYERYEAKQRGDVETYRMAKRRMNQIPSGIPDDPQYRRLRYIRYADDTLLGFIGPREEAEEIKHKLTTFLTSIGLTLSEEKTLITHAREQRARFLGYDISVAQADAQHTNGRRATNGKPMLHVPAEVVTKWRKRVTYHNKPQHRKQLLERSDYDIVMTYATEFNGLVNYYILAYDVSKRLYPLKYLYMTSLVNTLARKHNKPATWVYRRYKRKNRNECTAIVVEVPREGKKPLVAKFGHKPIRFDRKAIISDQPVTIWANRSQLIQRLLANQCELCGSTKNIQIHHIHKLKDLRQRYRGRPDPPPWVVKHIQLNRKTIVVCADCHQRIHAGKYDGLKLK